MRTLLKRMQVDGRMNFVTYITVLRVSHQSDDFVFQIVAVEHHVSSNRIGVAKVMACHCLIDDGYSWCTNVPKSKFAPRQQRRTQGLEIPRRNPVFPSDPAFPSLIVITLHGCRASGAGSLNRRSSADRR